jgi:hypothetical protein
MTPAVSQRTVDRRKCHAVEYLFQPLLICPYIGGEHLVLRLSCTQIVHLRGKRGEPGLPSLELLAFAKNQVILSQVAKLARPLGDAGGYRLQSALPSPAADS